MRICIEKMQDYNNLSKPGHKANANSCNKYNNYRLNENIAYEHGKKYEEHLPKGDMVGRLESPGSYLDNYEINKWNNDNFKMFENEVEQRDNRSEDDAYKFATFNRRPLSEAKEETYKIRAHNEQ